MKCEKYEMNKSSVFFKLYSLILPVKIWFEFWLSHRFFFWEGQVDSVKFSYFLFIVSGSESGNYYINSHHADRQTKRAPNLHETSL